MREVEFCEVCGRGVNDAVSPCIDCEEEFNDHLAKEEEHAAN